MPLHFYESSLHSFPSIIDWKFNSRSPNYNAFSSEPFSQILILSLVDGTIFALDFETGNLLWSINEENMSFLSFKMNNSVNKKEKQRYIPSSSGQIYKFNKDLVELVHSNDKGRLYFDEELLMTSLRQDTITIGVNIITGKLLYYCSPLYCFKNSTAIPSPSNGQFNLLVIQRILTITQIINVKTGEEYLNFISGRHELFNFNFNSNKSKTQNSKRNLADVEGLHYDINTNTIYFYSSISTENCSHTDKMLCWNFQLPCPIQALWSAQKTSNEYVINKIRLASLLSIHIDGSYFFNEYKMIVSLDSKHYEIAEPCLEIMFLNVYNDFPFLQSIQDHHNDYSTQAHSYCDFAKIFTYTKNIRGESFEETSLDITTNDLSAKQLAIAVENITKIRHKIRYHSPRNIYTKSLKITAGWKNSISLTQYNSQSYINMKSFFTEDFILLMPFIAFWRELIYIGFILYLVFLFILRGIKLIHNGNQTLAAILYKCLIKQSMSNGTIPQESIIDDGSIKSFDDESSPNVSTMSPPLSQTSRYASDFQHIGLLGSGGFGVVFKAKNIVDDCVYAVKRVTLPDCSNSREKVMREVKALAKLNHRGIVRFYNAWFEIAPSKDATLPSSADEDNENSSSKEKSVKYKELLPNNLLESSTDSIVNNFVTNKSTKQQHKNEKNSINSDVSIDFVSENNMKYDTSVPLWENVEESLSSSSCVEESGHSPFGGNRSTTTSLLLSCNLNKSECSHQQKIYLYIQMQLCHKHTLRSWLSKNPTNRNLFECVSIFNQVLSAVEYVHLHKLMHRDLKPSNIFFALDGSVKIGDFGLVAMISSSSRSPLMSSVASDSNLEHNPEEEDRDIEKNYTKMVGTELYMSPEQLNHLPYNQKIDIYSLGLIFFELLIPFTTQAERQYLITNAKWGLFPPQMNTFPPQFINLLKWMLQYNYKKRPSVTEIFSSEIFKSILKYSQNVEVTSR